LNSNGIVRVHLSPTNKQCPRKVVTVSVVGNLLVESSSHSIMDRNCTIVLLLCVSFFFLPSMVALENFAEVPRSALTARSYECGFCELVMYTIYTYLTQNSTESEVANVVAQICDYVPNNEEAFVCNLFLLLICFVV
jgi:hypothetical protein